MTEPQNLEEIVNATVQKNVTAGRRLDRGLQIAKHYRWRQIALRGWKSLSNRVRSKRLDTASPSSDVQLRNIDDRVRQAATVIATDHASRSTWNCQDLTSGRLTLINEPHVVGWPIDWRFSQSSSPSHLWRFQLQYHEFMLGAIAGPSDKAPIWSAMQSWLDTFEPSKSSRSDGAWHPYCISRRVPAWLWILILGNPPVELRQSMQLSLWQQVEYLSRNFEHDLGGNHLLENLFAVSIAANMLESPESVGWSESAGRFLVAELNRQILPHGEHFERSPMYHCQILANVLLVEITCRNQTRWLADACRGIAEKMVRFLSNICHPDGEIPLFGDSGFDEALSIVSLKNLARIADVAWPESTEGALKTGPYWIARNGSSSLLLDCGDVGAEALPAHAHCDLLGFEASLDGERWFVDSGNFNYEDDSMRDFCRSSLAHNVVTIGRRNHCDVWSKFRMGSRGKPSDVRSGAVNDFQWICASHDAYRGIGVPKVWRVMAAQGDAIWLCAEWIPINSAGDAEGWLHLAPEIRCRSHGADLFQLAGQTNRRLRFFGQHQVALMKGWYCRGFGRREPNQVFCYQFARSEESLTGWLQTKDDANVRIDVSATEIRLIEAGAGTADREIFQWDFATCI